MSEDTHKTIDQLMASMKKQFGDDIILRGKEMRSQTIPRITSGILSLDVALGGGFAVNQWHEVIGDESSGKTATVLKCVAANQALDPNWTVLWVAAEEFVPEYAAKIGVDLDRVIVLDTNIAENAFNGIIEFAEARAVDAVVVDSLPALVPGEEAEKSMEDFQVGLVARLSGKFLRKVRKSGRRSLLTEDRPFTGFFINQYRVKVGGWAPHGQEPTTTPGGRAKNYHVVTQTEIRRGEWLGDGEKDPNTNKPIYTGQSMVYTLKKNKTAPPRGTASADFYFTGEFDRVKDIFNTAMRLGVIERGGAYYRFGDEQWKGRQKAHVSVATSPALQQALSDAVYEVVTRKNEESAEALENPEKEDAA